LFLDVNGDGRGNHELRAASVLFGQFEQCSTPRRCVGPLLADPIAKNDVEIVRFSVAELIEALKSLGGNPSKEILTRTDAFARRKDFRPPKDLWSAFAALLHHHSGDSQQVDLRKYFQETPAVPLLGRKYGLVGKTREFGEEDPRPSSFYATQIAVRISCFRN